MPFPAESAHPDERGLFVVQDPLLRSRILPLFSFDPRQPTERPIGHGTTFRIDPWGGCATAFHVVEDLLTVTNGRATLRHDIRLAALELEGLAYGKVALPQENWRPFSGLFSLCGIDQPPLGGPRIRNLTELAALLICRSATAQGQTAFLPLDMSRWRPAAGERVMALGFADLDVDHDGEGDLRAMTQYLYGSEARIIEVQPPNPESSRPWPVFRVEADWPGGMSGGPVFNEAGHVIGLVSTGLVGAGVGTATCFAGWNVPEQTLASLDPNNPGWIKCWVAFDGRENIIGVAQNREYLQPLADRGDARRVALATLNPVTGDYMILPAV